MSGPVAVGVADAPERPIGLVHRLRADPLVRNSFYLMMTTALAAGCGFVFWVLVARLYPASQVGQATSLLSVVTLLSYLSQFGLSSSLVRHLPTTARRAEHVSSALGMVALTSLVLATGFALLVPVVSPELSFVASSPARIALFAVLAMCVTENLLTDSVFIASRAARYNLVLDGVLMSLVKLALPAIFVAAGQLGIFLSSTLASAVTAVASVLLIRRVLRIRVRPVVSIALLRSTLRYSLGNYVSSCLNLAPLMVIPLLVLHRMGPVAAAVYFVAFQIANLVNSASYAVGETLFAEGSHEQESLRLLARRSGVLTLVVTAPAAVAAVLLAHPVLLVFGSAYATHAQGPLVVLALSSFAVAFNTWSSFLLKVSRQLTAMNLSNVVYAAVTIGLAVVGTSHGLVWIAVAWCCGNLVSGLVATIAVVPRLRGTDRGTDRGEPAARPTEESSCGSARS